MNTSDFETRAIVRPERIKHIVAAIGCGAIGLTFIMLVITEIMVNPDFKLGVIPIILLVGVLLIPVLILIDMNLLRITAAGNTIYVKNLNITQTFEVSLKEIQQITFRSMRYKDKRIYYTAITTADHTVEISNAQLGYKAMLIYLKEKYDSGVIPSSAISKFDYPQLFENIEFYSNT